jgi:CubicO group peptidase (beta-lactamase class C family)
MRLVPRGLCLLIGTLAVAGCSLAAEPSPVPGRHPVPPGEVVNGALGAALDGFLTGLVADGLSGAVLVARREEVFLKRGYGTADRERDRPNVSETRFNVAAVAKIFTAAAILRLQADGRLSVSEPVERYLGAFPPGKQGITLHQLLIHTSGLVGAGAELDLSSRQAFVASVKTAPRAGPAGEDFSYSDAGYTLLAAVVEEVAGQPFEDFLRQRLFVPTGMSATGFVWEPAAAGPPPARGYEGQQRQSMTPAEPLGAEWGLRGSQGVTTTVGDLYRWVLGLRDGTVLPPGEVSQMLTAYVGNEGYAWHVVDSVDGPLVRRGGGLPGFECSIRWYRDDDLIIIFALNNELGLRIPVARGIDRIVKEHPAGQVRGK